MASTTKTGPNRRIAFRIDSRTAKSITLSDELGFDGLELALESLPDAELAKTFLANLPKDSPTIIAVSATCSATDHDTAIPAVIAALAATAQLGATCLNLSLAPLENADHPHGFPSYQSAINFLHRLFDATRFEAERSGVALAIEVANGGCFLSPVEMRELIDASSSWALGVCLDTARLAAIGNPADWIQTLTHRVHAVRITDLSSDDRLLRQTASALIQTSFDRTICVAGETEPALALRNLKELGFLPQT